MSQPCALWPKGKGEITTSIIIIIGKEKAGRNAFMPSVLPERVAPCSNAHPALRPARRGLQGTPMCWNNPACLSRSPWETSRIPQSWRAVTFGDRTEVPKAWTPASNLARDS